MYVQRLEPNPKSLDEDGWETVLVAPTNHEVMPFEIAKLHRDVRAAPAPVGISRRDEHILRLRVIADVSWIGGAVFKTVVRVGLPPGSVWCGTVINVVTERTLHAATQVRAFVRKARVAPVRVIGQHLSNLHNVHQPRRWTIGSGAQASNPIPNSPGSSDARLARRQRAIAEKRIGRETVVPGNHI